MKRVALGVLATTVAGLLLAGGYSLVTGRSLTEYLQPSSDAVRRRYNQERLSQAARNPGPYRVHPDPLIGFVFQANTTFELARARVHTDELGLRRRVGSAPADDAFRIALLGDSVAFGQGLRGDQCLAHRLETFLTDVRGPGARQVVCDTVAVPGWNTLNATHFLRTHFDRYQPDVVVYLPVGNDLSDTEAVFETGHRRAGNDLASRDPWLTVNQSRNSHVLAALVERVERGFEPAMLGADILRADLGGESSRRYDLSAQRILDLESWLGLRGVPLVVTQNRKNEFSLHLQRRLLSARPSLPILPLLERAQASDSLGHDAHANAATTRQFALWIAEWLLERGLVPAEDGHPLPPTPMRWAERRARSEAVEPLAALCAAERASARARLRARVDVASGEGLQQLYGGLTPAGSLGPRLLVALARARSAVEVELGLLHERPDLYPLEVAVEIDGQPCGALLLSGNEPLVRARFPVPTGSCSLTEPVEVRLLPAHWGVLDQFGAPELAACELRRVECVDPW